MTTITDNSLSDFFTPGTRLILSSPSSPSSPEPWLDISYTYIFYLRDVRRYSESKFSKSGCFEMSVGRESHWSRGYPVPAKKKKLLLQPMDVRINIQAHIQVYIQCQD
jgi:hypothetical protein